MKYLDWNVVSWKNKRTYRYTSLTGQQFPLKTASVGMHLGALATQKEIAGNTKEGCVPKISFCGQGVSEEFDLGLFSPRDLLNQTETALLSCRSSAKPN